MLGIYRYILAVAVAGGHIWSPSMLFSSFYAVFCFYLISGYLMSLVLNEVYVTHSDTLKYIANRALRIYPPYLVVLALSAIAIFLFSSHLADPIFHGLTIGNAVNPPADLFEWFANLTLIYGFDVTLLVSQCWSLRVELVFYVAMIFLVRNFAVVVVWFVLSLLYVVYLQYTNVLFHEYYTTVLGSSLAFSAGALIYYSMKKYRIRGWHVPVATVAFFGHMVFSGDIWGYETGDFLLVFKPGSYGIYTNLALGAYLLYAILCAEGQQKSKNSVSKTLGDIAYAIFLSHWCIAFFMMSLGLEFSDSPAFAVINFLLLNLVALGLYFGVEKPINRHFRDKIRSSVRS
jgi:peptidoglycan/LPS O-acetylase OafA/YrhL